jgi:hypothetical protein
MFLCRTFFVLLLLGRVEYGLARGPQLGPDPNMPPEELLSFNLANNNNNNLNEFGKPRSHTKGSYINQLICVQKTKTI